MTTNVNLALCSLSAKMEEPMKEHHQIQSHTNALGGQGLRLTLQSGKMDDLNVCLDFQCLYAYMKLTFIRFPSVPGVAKHKQWSCEGYWPRARC